MYVLHAACRAGPVRFRRFPNLRVPVVSSKRIISRSHHQTDSYSVFNARNSARFATMPRVVPHCGGRATSSRSICSTAMTVVAGLDAQAVGLLLLDLVIQLGGAGIEARFGFLRRHRTPRLDAITSSGLSAHWLSSCSSCSASQGGIHRRAPPAYSPHRRQATLACNTVMRRCGSAPCLRLYCSISAPMRSISSSTGNPARTARLRQMVIVRGDADITAAAALAVKAFAGDPFLLVAERSAPSLASSTRCTRFSWRSASPAHRRQNHFQQ